MYRGEKHNTNRKEKKEGKGKEDVHIWNVTTRP